MNRSESSSFHFALQVLCFFAATTIPIVGSAAEVTIVPARSGMTVHWDKEILFKGEIVNGDLSKVKDAVRSLVSTADATRYSPVVMNIDTKGGDVDEAIAIGRFSRELLLYMSAWGNLILGLGSKDAKFYENKDLPIGTKIIPPSQSLNDDDIVKVYSAGVLILLGGVERYYSDNTDKRAYPRSISIPVIGIHRPYYDKEQYAKLSPELAAKKYGELETNVRTYMTEMGASQQLIERMLRTSSEHVDLVPADTFRSYVNSQEPFIEEWLIAKCGSFSDSAALSGNELGDYLAYSKQQTDRDSQKLLAELGLSARANPNSDRNEENGGANDERASKSDTYVQSDYEKYLRSKVRAHNAKVTSCRRSAVYSHQKTWAASKEKSNK